MLSWSRRSRPIDEIIAERLERNPSLIDVSRRATTMPVGSAANDSARPISLPMRRLMLGPGSAPRHSGSTLGRFWAKTIFKARALIGGPGMGSRSSESLPARLPKPTLGRPIRWLAALPFIGLIIGPFFVNRPTPLILGLPFLLARSCIYWLDPANREDA